MGRSGVARGLRYGGCVSAVGWHKNVLWGCNDGAALYCHIRRWKDLSKLPEQHTK